MQVAWWVFIATLLLLLGLPVNLRVVWRFLVDVNTPRASAFKLMLALLYVVELNVG